MEDEMGGTCGTYGWEQKGMGNLVRKREGKRGERY
jgi:hypothetical protein